MNTEAPQAVVWYKAVKHTDDPGVFCSRYGDVLWRVGQTNTLEGADGAEDAEGAHEPVLCRRGFHACRNPVAPFLLFLGYGYSRETDALLEVALGGKIVSDGIKCAGTSCTPLRVVPAEEWAELVRPPAVLVNTAGTEYHVKDGVLHRDGGEPAVIWSDGSQEWFKDGVRNREGDAPAVIMANGSQAWYKYGKMHREGDAPAVIWADGSQEWYKNGKLHRDGHAPAVIWADGSQAWYKDGVLVRV